MYIFVDESGTFSFADKRNAWCSIAAFVLPESKRRQLEALVSRLRFRHGGGREIKLGSLHEKDFIKFLIELKGLEGIAFALAVDVGLHRHDEIQHHQAMQVQKLRENIGKMKFEEGRLSVASLADDISSLPLQLYTQLILQVELVHNVLKNAPLYYVQRTPVALANFRWRIDQKDRIPSKYERAFKFLLPALLQSKSLSDPMFFLEDADYRHFAKFEYAPGTAPTYLQDEYGLEVETNDKNVVNVGRLINEDFAYVDSAEVAGVQVADLIASGVRRVLRSNFDSPDRVAIAIGMNLLEAARGEPTIRLLSLDQSGRVDETAAGRIRLMGLHARPMLLR